MKKLNRRQFIQGTMAAGVSLSLPIMMSGCQSPTDINTNSPSKLMATRSIPSSGESLGVIGYSSASTFRKDGAEDTEAYRALLKLLVDAGGNYIDTDVGSEQILAGLLKENGSLDQVFMGSSVGSDYKIRGSAVEDLQRSQDTLGKNSLDLAQVRYLVDMENRWPVLQEWKESGRVRHIGVTAAHYSEYDKLEAIMNRYRPDFVQVNYSVLEPEAEERILPLAKDLGIAVVVNRPFVVFAEMRYGGVSWAKYGHYFGPMNKHPLPEWAAEFDCASWGQFGLKFILANAGVTCVMVESANSDEMSDYLQAGFGALPDDRHLKQMREHVKELIQYKI